MVTDQDRTFMERALVWAGRGRGRTSPNPMVGAVVVTPDGTVVGQGAHMGAGGPHAEVVALDRAGDRARGATLYCTLEPCAHTGRTGPCAERIVAAGVTRVVAAVTDPNPRVSGRGFAYLRAHGLEVTIGVEEEAAARLNAPFFTWVRTGRPFVIAKAAVSEDGFVGTGVSATRLTGDRADRFFHRQRAEIDAIAVGSGTVLVDDPQLTARGAHRFRPLVRLIVDWRGRVSPDARVFSTLSAGPVIMVVLRSVLERDRARQAALARRGVELLPCDTRDLRAVMTALGGRDVVSLLVEGGPTLHDACAEADLVDRIQLVRTPAVLGAGVPVSRRLRDLVATAAAARHTTLGDDELVEVDVHRPD